VDTWAYFIAKSHSELIDFDPLSFMQRQTETVHFMQVVPWLGVVPNKDGQLQQLLADDNYSPLVSLFKQATEEVLSHPGCLNNAAFVSMAKQAEVAGAFFLLFFLSYRWVKHCPVAVHVIDKNIIYGRVLMWCDFIALLDRNYVFI